MSIVHQSGVDRGVSPIIGIVFMVAAVIIIAASIGVTVMGSANGVSDPAPQVKFDVEPTDTGVKITHANGDSIDDDQIKLVGDATTETIPEWSGETVSVGDSATVNTNEGEMKIVWEGESETDSYTLASKDVPETLPTVEVNKIIDGHFSDDHITVKTGSVSNIENVYAVVEGSGGGSAVLTSGETERLSKDDSYPGPGDTHTVKIYKTSTQQKMLLECEVERSGWGRNEFDSPC